MEIAWLEIADRPELWRSLGFVVDEEGRCVIGSVEHRLIGSGQVASDGDQNNHRGIVRWAVTGLNQGLDPLVNDIDGLPTAVVEAHDQRPGFEHPNGVFRIDHLVLATSDTPRTAAALSWIGLERRGGRTTNSAGDAVDMTFFWAGDTLVELAGPPTPAVVAKPARFAGIAYATKDLDATAALLGPRGTTPADAVQPGRRIAALTRSAGSTMPMAFMTPHVRRR
jgi:hypothetical protein